MSDAQQASAAGRSLANLRWRGQHVIRCADVVVERIAELPDAEVVRLAHAVDEDAGRRAIVTRAETKR